MDYSGLSKNELIQKIEELQILNRQLLGEKEQEIKLDYSWTGNLGHWYWNIKTNTVTFNPLKITTLGYNNEEIPKNVGYQFFVDKLHPEDYQKTMDTMSAHLNGKTEVYEVEYRIRTKDGSYKQYYDRGKITKYDEDGKPLFLAGIVFDITEKKKTENELKIKNKKLSELSYIDGLTKVKNHRAIVQHLKNHMSNYFMNKQKLSMAIFDIDDFKKVNDTKGHIFGDKVLFNVANIMKNNVRETDIVGRYGGEEFMIIFPKTSLEAALRISNRIRQAIEQYSFDDDKKITISGGVKEYNGESLEDFIHKADNNLYRAKKSGKNKVVCN